jgi:hypothetical protein
MHMNIFKKKINSQEDAEDLLLSGIIAEDRMTDFMADIHDIETFLLKTKGLREVMNSEWGFNATTVRSIFYRVYLRYKGQAPGFKPGRKGPGRSNYKN